MNKWITILITVVVLFCGISCSDSLGLIASIENETELSDASLAGYIQNVFSVGDRVYAVNGNIYQRSWNGSSLTGWSKVSVPSKFTAIRYAGALNSKSQILGLFDEGDSRVFADGGLQYYGIASDTWTAATISGLNGKPCAVFSSCDSSFVYLLTKESGTEFHYYLYEWAGDNNFSHVYTSPETDVTTSSKNQTDKYRPRAVTKSGGAAFFVTKNGIYEGNSLVKSISGDESKRDGGVGITSDSTGKIYAIDHGSTVYYSVNGGSTWSSTSSYSPEPAGESASLQYVPANTFSPTQTSPLILVASDSAGYYELQLGTSGVPVSTMNQPGTVTGVSSIPYVNGKKSFSQYYSAIGKKTLFGVFYVKSATNPSLYSVYTSVVDDINTCLWGYHVDGSVAYTETTYPKWDRE